MQKLIFGEGANESYYSYEDLPSNQFASEAKNLATIKNKLIISEDGLPIKINVVENKTASDLITSIKENFINAKATDPEKAPNWKLIPFRDHQERKRLPDYNGYVSTTISIGVPGAGMAVNSNGPLKISQSERNRLLKTGNYVPQNHSTKSYNLTNFPAAPSSIQNGDKRKGATGH